MFKNKPLIISILLVLVLGSISILCFKQPIQSSEEYNVIVINNTGEKIKSVGYYQGKESGGIINADNSLIKDGEKLYFNMKNEKFNLSVTDKSGKEFKSQEFSIDLSNKNKKCGISIEKDKDGNFVFNLV